MKFKWLIISFLVFGTNSFFAQQDSIIQAKVELEPTYQVFYNDGVTQLEKKDYDAAIGLFERAVSMKQDFERGYFLKGVALYNLNKFNLAFEALNQALKITPTFDAYYYIAQIQLKEKKNDEAFANLTKSLSLKKDYPNTHYSKGVILYQQKDFVGAIQSFDSTILYNPTFAFAFNDRASANLELGKLDLAIEDYKKATEKNPESSVIFNNLGSAYRKKGLFKEAVIAYDKSISLNNQYILAYNNRGVAKIEKGDYQSAIEDFNKALSIDSKYIFAVNNRANAKNKLKDYQGAITDCSKVIEMDPNFGIAYLNRGIAKENLNRFTEACEDWQKALNLGVEQAKTFIDYCH